ncbi:hypothetical protein KY319_03080, partial [Candidatus Woesearchaeota archaeon]|nr:hypothetical protein [Candidatus Woesearchaeota archaeon]
MVLSAEIKTVLDLLKNPETGKQVLRDAFLAVSKRILSQYPSKDLKDEVDILLESFENVPFVDEMRDFLDRMYRISAHREKGLPLGVGDREQLRLLRDAIM